MTPTLSTVVIEPTAEHIYSVIWLHGLGADGHDFESIVPSLHIAVERQTRFVFPDAPIQPVTINGKLKMRAWYDILAMSVEDHQVDMGGIYQSANLIEPLIMEEVGRGVMPHNIILAGFSQGGVIALHVGLRYPHTLGGIVALSTYLPTLNKLPAEGSKAGLATPIFMGHGILDSVVAVEAGKKVFEGLKQAGYRVEWHDYLMEHSVCVDEINHLSSFINSKFSTETIA